MDNKKYLTVSGISNYLKYKFDSDKNLQTICIKGEVSNFKRHASGFYFSLKDEEAVINASMFTNYAKRVNFDVKDGQTVLVTGRISIYPKGGRYQINIVDMQLDGVGNLFLAFEKLKQDLYKEGLFDPKHKKRIPKFPKRVGVITAPTGAAVRDIISTIKRRCPVTEVILFPSLVQGDQAAADIVRNIKLAEQFNLDTLIVGRGGGSIEDLWPFNEEIVARAIYNCSIPVISGTGHEPDITIADYVADLRAPTPTGAAEIAVPVLIEVINIINVYNARLTQTMNNRFKQINLRLNKYKEAYVIKTPALIYENKKQQLALNDDKLENLLMLKLERRINSFKNINAKLKFVNPASKFLIKTNQLKNNHEKLNMVLKGNFEANQNRFKLYESKLANLIPTTNINVLKGKLESNNQTVLRIMNNYIQLKQKGFYGTIEKLELLNPLGVLKRGYSITYKNNELINDVKKVKENDELKIKLQNGYLITEVRSIKEN